MNQIVARRKFLGFLAASPAAAKAMAEQITTQAAVKAAGFAADMGVPSRGYGHVGSVGLSGPGGVDPWEKMRQWTNAEILAGRIPDHRLRELRGAAPFQARFCDDADVEGLLSVSRSHKKRMHLESTFRRMIRDEKRQVEERTLWDSLMKRFGA